jgi:hypothetical protein
MGQLFQDASIDCTLARGNGEIVAGARALRAAGDAASPAIGRAGNPGGGTPKSHLGD